MRAQEQNNILGLSITSKGKVINAILPCKLKIHYLNRPVKDE
jgi:hypothetical protein